jgi:hypothetical protein
MNAPFDRYRVAHLERLPAFGKEQLERRVGYGGVSRVAIALRERSDRARHAQKEKPESSIFFAVHENLPQRSYLEIELNIRFSNPDI